MSETKLQTEKDFLVKESLFINNFFGIFLLAIFVGTMIFGDYGWGVFFQAVGLFLLPAGYFFYRGRSKEVRIKINLSGFYYGNKLIMDWDHFVQAELTQDSKLASIKDNFIILLHYRLPGDRSIYEKKIPMSNTQDKADEEIIEAIDFYYKKSRERRIANLLPGNTLSESSNHSG